MCKNKIAMPLHLACSADENYHPVMCHVHFKGGFAYASDGCIMVKQSLAYMSIENPEALNGKMIHRNVFKEICRCSSAVATPDGIECTKNGVNMMLPFGSCDAKPPNFDAVVPDYEPAGVVKLMISPVSFDTAAKCLYSNGRDRINLVFYGDGKMIKMSVYDYPDQFALVVPFHVNSY